MIVDSQTEKIIAINLLKCLYHENYVPIIFNSLFYSEEGFMKRDNNMNEGGNSSLSSVEYKKPIITIKVENLTPSCYVKHVFPQFCVKLVVQSSPPLLASIIPEIELKITVWNKWVDVSSEVLPEKMQARKVKNGILNVSDFMINEVSLVHGGYFIIHIQPLNNKNSQVQVLPWQSGPITIINSKASSTSLVENKLLYRKLHKKQQRIDHKKFLQQKKLLQQKSLKIFISKRLQNNRVNSSSSSTTQESRVYEEQLNQE
eukprot:c31106_g1_i1.p1 GENE.c31106_g1_i1~~c31106_g1_i1.p1  ORF type:complete len:268 (+),score=26.44 c31106_g1_i1:29-805(+)